MPTASHLVSWRSIATCLALFLIANRPRAADWPQFLGPQRNGISTETGLNWDWKVQPPKVRWKVPIGNGFSSAAVVGNRIYTMAKRGSRDGVVCLDAKDGKEIWFYDAAPTYLDKQKQGPGPRATPVLHEGRLYCLFPMGELVCLTDKGKRVWQVNVFTDTGAKNPAGGFYYWGVSYTPLVEGDAVVVLPGGNKGNAVAAYHKDTGNRLWMAGDGPFGYASPIAITVGGQRCVVCPTGRSVLGIEPTRGTVLWRHDFGNKFNATCSTPVWQDNILFVSAAYGGGCTALELKPGKARWTVRQAWGDRKRLQSLYATSIVIDGYLYGMHGDLSAFQLRCLDLKTGEVKWSERVDQRYSLLSAEKKLLVWGERGSLLLVRPTPDAYTVEGELPNLLAYKSWAMPALADGMLYLRDDRHLVCLDLRRK
jgi:outer membrane protein assembly factor BamB